MKCYCYPKKSKRTRVRHKQQRSSIFWTLIPSGSGNMRGIGNIKGR